MQIWLAFSWVVYEEIWIRNVGISPLYHIKNPCLALGDPKNQCDKYKSSRCTISCPVKRKCTNLVTGTSLYIVKIPCFALGSPRNKCDKK